MNECIKGYNPSSCALDRWGLQGQLPEIPLLHSTSLTSVQALQRLVGKEAESCIGNDAQHSGCEPEVEGLQPFLSRDADEDVKDVAVPAGTMLQGLGPTPHSLLLFRRVRELYGDGTTCSVRYRAATNVLCIRQASVLVPELLSRPGWFQSHRNPHISALMLNPLALVFLFVLF